MSTCVRYSKLRFVLHKRFAKTSVFPAQPFDLNFPTQYHVTMPTVAYCTLGCKVNQYETEKIRQALEQAGFTTVPFNTPADIYLVNTCSVTAVADSKSRSAIRRALKLNPSAVVFVTGCYAELEPDFIRNALGINHIISNLDKETAAQKIIAQFNTDSSVQSIVCATEKPVPQLRIRTRAVVKVQDGCDQFCSYCIIPHARSIKSSRCIADVEQEIRSLATFGYKEVVLTGIRLGSYESDDSQVDGSKYHAQKKLPDLITAVAEIDGIERIRLSSIEPWEVDEALLEAMKSAKVCRHLHIPLQSGDDEVLKLMNRPYTAEQYRQTVDAVRSQIPDIGITTDVIVGFPGESERAFGNTCALIEDIGFSRIHVFRYSPRERTPAATTPGQVHAEEKKQRAEKLISIGIDGQRRFAKSLIGKSASVLVERQVSGSNHLAGFTDNYVETRFPGDISLRGQVVSVKIVAVDQNCAIATMQ